MADRIITFEYAKANYDAYKKQVIPNTKEAMTKADVEAYINADMTLLTNYTNTRLVPRVKVSGVVTNYDSFCFFFNGPVNSIAIQNDGKYVVVGNFTKYKDTLSENIARINPDGTYDTTFNVGSGLTLVGQAYYVCQGNVVKIQSDGKILVGGCFEKYNTTNITSMVRINTDGSIDSSFVPNRRFFLNESPSTEAGYVSDILILGTTMLVAGVFETSDLSPNVSLVKITSTGSTDYSFNPPGNSPALYYPDSIVTDGTNFYVSGVTYSGGGIIKIGPTGTYDPAFNIGGFPTYSKFVKLNPSDGNLYYADGIHIRKCSKTSPTVLASYQMPGSITAIEIDNNGKILVGFKYPEL